MVKNLRRAAISTSLNVLSGMARLAPASLRGLGAILMFHHVRPWTGNGFAPNRGLEITPEFLETTIRAVRNAGFEIVSMDAAIAIIAAAAGGEAPPERPFAVLTFDDGYRDNTQYALPVLRRMEAPFTLYAAPGFAQGEARLWWVELEESIRRLDHIEVRAEAFSLSSETRTDAQKESAFKAIYWRLRALPEEKLLAIVGGLALRAGLDSAAVTTGLCMNWDEIAAFAAEPLCTLGAHTMTHPRLATLPLEAARGEIEASRREIEERTGKPVRHFAYPVGDPASAGLREFGLAREAGFASGVTTRKGMVFAGHAQHLMALPRLSINGEYQSENALGALLSGAPFFLKSLGRKLDVA